LIDLAGSERAAETKERREEGSHINKSLLTLGTVIARLSDAKDKDGKPLDKSGKHLPYRDSKLTRLLQGALSGDSLVSILCTIQIGAAGSAAAANTHTNETLNTLKFASRAKNNIVSHAKKAEEALGAGGDGGARVLLERYRLEIQDLRTQLEKQAKDKEVEEEVLREKEAEQRHEEQMLEMQLARTALKERIEHLNRLIISSKSTGVNASGSYSSLSMHPRLSTMTSNGHLANQSNRSSLAASTVNESRKSLDRRTSTNSQSTLGQLPQSENGGRIVSGEQTSSPVDDEDSMGEFGDGTASLAVQNAALRADLADKNRYIVTLEKRLLQARRSSHSRASIGFSKGGVMVGEDHGVAALLREKDAEIQELRARLDDKDHMLTALRSAERARHAADRHTSEGRQQASLTADNLSALGRSASTRATSTPKETPLTEKADPLGQQAVFRDKDTNSNSKPERAQPRSPRKSLGAPPTSRPKRQSVDEMSKMLDEMLQDRVERGELVKTQRGSVRLPAGGVPKVKEGLALEAEPPVPLLA
jgi:centromeric protein E